jgi:predicted PhzF superfamily epimerase YddE/YHI9
MCDIDVRGFIASAEAKDVDFVSRCFFPITGINEDPVTGSAHTTLIPYWSNRLNKNNMMAKQLSERGGLLDCSIKDDRVFIGGQAVLYFSGTIEIKS